MKTRNVTPNSSVIEDIKNRIYIIRGEKVMLDFDLALLYGVTTKALNQAVRRNKERFPPDFMSVVSRVDEESLRSQIVTANLKSQFVTSSYGGRRKPITTFTEQGIAMLSSVLRSSQAIQINIHIMRTFTKLRQMLASHKELKEKIELLEKKYDGQFRLIFQTIQQMLAEEERPKEKLGFRSP